MGEALYVEACLINTTNGMMQKDVRETKTLSDRFWERKGNLEQQNDRGDQLQVDAKVAVVSLYQRRDI